MTEFNFDESIVSDLYKDAYGSRSFVALWPVDGSELEKQAEWDRVCRDVKSSIEDDKERDSLALNDFESIVSDSLSYGAQTRAQAILWALEGAGYKRDSPCQTHSIDYAFYNLGLNLKDSHKIKKEIGL